jgi:hypothetical protein
MSTYFSKKKIHIFSHRHIYSLAISFYFTPIPF